MPCELRVQRLWMEDDHFSFGGADGQAHAEAEVMHTINQVLQPMRSPRKDYDVVGIPSVRARFAQEYLDELINTLLSVAAPSKQLLNTLLRPLRNHAAINICFA